MNVYRYLLETKDQYQREQRLNAVIKEFRERVSFLIQDAENPLELRDSPIANEAVAFSRFMDGNTGTERGLKMRNYARIPLERAKNHPDWSEDLATVHKRSRVSLASIVGYVDDDVEIDLQRSVLPSDIETI